MKLKIAVLISLLPLIFSCAPATGVGEFPALSIAERSQANLAILAVRGEVENKIKYRLVNNLDLDQIRDSFRSIRFMPDRIIDELEIPQAGPLGQEHLEKLTERTPARYLLDISIEEFGEEQFTDRDRETLYYYRTRMQQRTYYDRNELYEVEGDTPPGGPPEGPGRRIGPPDNNGDNNNRERDMYERIYGREDIPVEVDRIRVVMLVSARIYDLREKQIIWNGRRLERAEGDLRRTSPVELTERVLGRLGGHLSRAITDEN